MDILKKHSVIALSYFLLITALGVLLRCFSIVIIDFNYRHIVHAHSHIALLGWVYTALMILIYQLYLRKVGVEKQYFRVFWCTQITIIGMLLTFPFTGYALFSILFSTLFLIASYFFSYLVFKYTPKKLKSTNSYKCIRLGLWYMIISSIGPWALGIIMNTLGEMSSWYRNAIYFYLHFQYNGWFILTLLGILLGVLELHKIHISKKVFNYFFILFNIGILCTFFISILWMKLHWFVNVLAGIGGAFQIVAFILLLSEIKSQKKKLYVDFSSVLSFTFKALLILFGIKLLLQIVGTLPYFSNAISSNIDFVIGYIHWIFLGIVSLGLLGFFHYFKYIRISRVVVINYLVTFLFTEVLIFYRGFVQWKNLELSVHYNYSLFIGSVLFLFILTSTIVSQLKKN